MISRDSLHNKLFDELHAIVVKEIQDRKLMGKDIAGKCGVTPAFISQLMNPSRQQKRFLPSLVRVADALNIDISLTRV